jgi:hypothetical protein
MKTKPLNSTCHKLFRWLATIATALSLSPWTFGQLISEQRLNEAAQVEFKGNAHLGSGGSGVSGIPSDRAYSIDAASYLGAMQDNIPGTGNTMQVTDTGGAAQPKRFYRIVVNP